jgi:hypothetical protein
MTAAYDSRLAAGGVSLQSLAGDAGETSLSQARWNEAAVQVNDYFRAFGIDAERDLNRLARQVLQHLAVKVEAQTPPEQLRQLAIEAAQQLLDEWLATVLGLQDTHQSQTLAAARAALRFCKESAHWPEGFLQTGVPAELRKGLQTAILQPVPTPRELLMETQPIDFWHPLASTGLGLWQFIKRLTKALLKHLHRR